MIPVVPETIEERDEFNRRELAAVVGLLLLSAVAGTIDVGGPGVQDALDIVAVASGAAFWVLLVWLVYAHSRWRRRRAAGDGAAASVYPASDGAARDHP
jgi:hypothetical protein